MIAASGLLACAAPSLRPAPQPSRRELRPGGRPRPGPPERGGRAIAAEPAAWRDARRDLGDGNVLAIRAPRGWRVVAVEPPPQTDRAAFRVIHPDATLMASIHAAAWGPESSLGETLARAGDYLPFRHGCGDPAELDGWAYVACRRGQVVLLLAVRHTRGGVVVVWWQTQRQPSEVELDLLERIRLSARIAAGLDPPP